MKQKFNVVAPAMATQPVLRGSRTATGSSQTSELISIACCGPASTGARVWRNWGLAAVGYRLKGAASVVDIESLTESADGVTARSHVTATHTGEFLGIAPTGRHIEWDHVAIVKIKNGRVVGQWAQPDLWRIYTQLTRDQPAPD